MNRSKLFLGATTCLLTIAGVAAAKINTYRSMIHRYYCTHVGTTIATAGKCITYGLTNCPAVPNGVSICRFVTAFGVKKYTLYIFVSADPAVTLCYSGAQTTNCMNVLRYNTTE